MYNSLSAVRPVAHDVRAWALEGHCLHSVSVGNVLERG